MTGISLGLIILATLFFILSWGFGFAAMNYFGLVKTNMNEYEKDFIATLSSTIDDSVPDKIPLFELFFITLLYTESNYPLIKNVKTINNIKKARFYYISGWFSFIFAAIFVIIRLQNI